MAGRGDPHLVLIHRVLRRLRMYCLRVAPAWNTAYILRRRLKELNETFWKKQDSPVISIPIPGRSQLLGEYGAVSTRYQPVYQYSN